MLRHWIKTERGKNVLAWFLLKKRFRELTGSGKTRELMYQ